MREDEEKHSDNSAGFPQCFMICYFRLLILLLLFYYFILLILVKF